MVEFTASAIATAALYFVVGLIVSSVIIFVVTKLLGEKEGFGTALLAGLVGAIIYAIAGFLLGHGLLSAIIGGIFWLWALHHLYRMSWLKSLGVAIIVWLITLVVGLFLPTVVP